MANVAIVTDAGLSIITNRLKNAGTSPKYIAWGVGTTEAAASGAGATLGSPSAEARTEGTETQENTGGTTGDTYKVAGAITCSGAAKAITEVALLDADTSGNTFMRANFAAINVEVGDSITFSISTTFNQV